MKMHLLFKKFKNITGQYWASLRQTECMFRMSKGTSTNTYTYDVNLGSC